MTNDSKDTIYIDVDDEITSVIDKLQSSSNKIVALVLPKRATVFQSIVNMKLLKRTAENEKKSVVLITSETALLPLAGAVGIHVAKTLQSKPEIPPAPMSVMAAANTADQDEDVQLDKSTSVGQLSGVPDDEQSIELDNSEVPDANNKTDTQDGSGKKAKKENTAQKKFKIPNFEKFRTKLFVGFAALALVIVGLVMALVVLPKATVVLQTDTSNIDIQLTLVADPGLQKLDKESKSIPALSKEFKSTDTEKVAATGEKNVGTKASGNVTMSITCSDVDGLPPTIPAGTGVSTNNLTFITKTSVSLTTPDFGDGCSFIGSVDVTAQNPGDEYNFGSGKSFTIAGYSAVSGTNDDSMTGGTDKVVKVVTQEDVDKAKDAINKRGGDKAQQQLKSDIQEAGYQPVDDTFKAGTPVLSSSPQVGAEASEVTVTSTTISTMTGIKKDDLKVLVEEEARTKIDPKTQVIIDNGLDKAVIKVDELVQNGQVKLLLQTSVVAGPDINEEALRTEITGKKRGDIQQMLKARPGINEVEVNYSPFWVQSTPKKADRITIVIEGNGINHNADSNQ
ncbi:hypothetical protein KC968_02125 [Candidatus Saccharibacteria bacterium]|nr:hypothetical protein [Candidatus Saccharibacteria bacterium]